MRNLKDKIEKHPIIFYLTTFFIGITVGIGIMVGWFNYNSNYIHTDIVNRDYIKLNDYTILKDKYQAIKDSCKVQNEKGVGNINELNSQKTTIINNPKEEIQIIQ